MALRELLLPWDSQPQEVASTADRSVYLATPFGVTGPRGEATLDLRGFYNLRAAQDGVVWDANTNTRSIDLGISGGSAYGILLLFDLSVAALTSSSSAYGVLGPNADALSGDGLMAGPSTGYLTGETLTLIDGTATRSGISDTIAVGRHALVIQWDTGSSRYVFRLDGAPATEVSTATPVGLQPAANFRHFCGRRTSSGPRIRPSLIAVSTTPGVDLRAYESTPWELFEPRRIFVPVSAGGGGATDLTVSEASHGHSADSLTLSTGVSLAINDATHGHAADAITLTTASTLAVADATHAHAADQVTLTLAGSESLTIADATHAHTADAPVLSVDSLLAVDDALHAHSADNVVLGVTGVADLIIADATHAHSVDGLVLTTDSLLAIQDALHAHAADELTLNSAPTLLIAEALHAHTSDGLLLTVDAWLVIADALHGHTADSIALGDSGAVVLVVADAVHAHAADTLRLFYEVWAATKAPIGARHASGARAARLSTTARPPRLSTRTR